MKRQALFLIVSAALASQASGGLLYSTAGSVVTQNFDSLPTVHATTGVALNSAGFSENIRLQSSAGYTTGWVNDVDAATSADPLDVGLKGWYLHHHILGTTTGITADTGASGHSRYIQGPGSSAGTGGFWGFNSPSNYAEKALGSVATSAGASAYSNSSNPLRIGFELVNNTGAALVGFTLTYDGEQYMDGRHPDPDSLRFSYSLTDTAPNYSANTWVNNGYTRVPALDFIAPNFNDYTNTTTPAAQVVDGNLPENRTANITGTVSGINWAPGTSIFLLWEDPFTLSGQNDGLAIDNVRFSAIAVPEPTSLALLGLAGLILPRRR